MAWRPRPYLADHSAYDAVLPAGPGRRVGTFPEGPMRRCTTVYACSAHTCGMSVVKDSRLAVRLSSDQDVLIRRAAEVEGMSITEFTVDAAVARSP